MAVRIRLKRVGKIHAAQYRVVVVDSRKKRDGRVIEEVGYYDPQPDPSVIRIDSERAQYWLGVGAQPSDQVRNLLVLTGDIAKFNGKADAVSRVIVPRPTRPPRPSRPSRTPRLRPRSPRLLPPPRRPRKRLPRLPPRPSRLLTKPLERMPEHARRRAGAPGQRHR